MKKITKALIVCGTAIILTTAVVTPIVVTEEIKVYEQTLDKEKVDIKNKYMFDENYFVDNNKTAPVLNFYIDIIDKDGNLISRLNDGDEDTLYTIEYPAVYVLDPQGEINIDIIVEKKESNDTIYYNKNISSNAEQLKSTNFQKNNGIIKHYKTKNEAITTNATKFESVTCKKAKESLQSVSYNVTYTCVTFSENLVLVYQTQVVATCTDPDIINRINEICVE